MSSISLGSNSASRCQWRGIRWEEIEKDPKAFKPGRAYFIRAAFGDGTTFDRAAFGGLASFDGAVFGDEASFVGAAFGDGPHFDNSSFRGSAYAKGADLRGKMRGVVKNFDAELAKRRTNCQPGLRSVNPLL